MGAKSRIRMAQVYDDPREELDELCKLTQGGAVTLVTATRDIEISHVAVLKRRSAPDSVGSLLDMAEIEPILPRELTDLADEVRSVPPPPGVAEVPEPYAFRLADPDADADAEMIAEWMSRPLLAETWEFAWPASRWRRYLRAQLDGGYSRPFLASLAGKDIAYVELYRAAKDSIAIRYEADPYDLGIHAAIADPEFANRGIAQYVLPYFVASVLGQDPHCRRIMFDPDHRNKTARMFCERAGCVFLGEHNMSNRRMALYALALSSGDVPQLREI